MYMYMCIMVIIESIEPDKCKFAESCTVWLCMCTVHSLSKIINQLSKPLTCNTTQLYISLKPLTCVTIAIIC